MFSVFNSITYLYRGINSMSINSSLSPALIHNLNNIHIAQSEVLSTPQHIKSLLPLSESAASTIWQSRLDIINLLSKRDNRKLLIVGPCSIHDLDSALAYAHKLQRLASKVSDKFICIMRVYFEKPRTTTGWKGFINDPNLDDSFDVDKGLFLARELLLDISEMGLPIATEILDPFIPQYLGDLFSWSAIGARTTESQTHREMASGLSMPVGFKNSTDGNISIAINAMLSAASSHRFLGINKLGLPSVFTTTGNPYSHLILRGGKLPNYDRSTIAQVSQLLRLNSLNDSIIVDCSHGNSNKDYTQQPLVFNDCVNQINEGSHNIIGLMLESHLFEGKQNLTLDSLRFGVSITDGCISFEQTEDLILSNYSRINL